MKAVQTQLKSAAKSLAGLAEKLEKLSNQVAGVSAKSKVTTKKKASPAKKAATKKKAPAKKPAKTAKAKAVAQGKNTVLDSVLSVIKKSRSGADIATLKTKTKLESRQLSNALYKLSKKKLIKSKSRGVYIKA